MKRLECTEKSMVRWMHNSTVKKGQISELGTENISEVTRTGRLHWCGCVERKDDNNKVKYANISRWKTVLVSTPWEDKG